MISKIKKYNFIDNIEYAYVLEDTTINSIEDTMKVYVPKLMVGCTIDKSNINLNTIINKKDFDKLYNSTISCVNYLTIKPISLNPMGFKPITFKKDHRIFIKSINNRLDKIYADIISPQGGGSIEWEFYKKEG
jgi:hypothetical protein